MEFLTEYISPITVAACLCIGYVIKQFIDGVKNKWIPGIVMAFGILFAWWANGTMSPETFVSGAFSGLSSTGCYELFRAFIEKDNG